jgi:hypothetical protein
MRPQAEVLAADAAAKIAFFGESPSAAPPLG